MRNHYAIAKLQRSFHPYFTQTQLFSPSVAFILIFQVCVKPLIIRVSIRHVTSPWKMKYVSSFTFPPCVQDFHIKTNYCSKCHETFEFVTKTIAIDLLNCCTMIGNYRAKSKIYFLHIDFIYLVDVNSGNGWYNYSK